MLFTISSKMVVLIGFFGNRAAEGSMTSMVFRGFDERSPQNSMKDPVRGALETSG